MTDTPHAAPVGRVEPVSGTRISDTRFSDTRFSDTRFSDTRFSDTRFSDTRFSDTRFSDTRFSDTRVIATVSAAHFVSHYYTLILAPLFAFVRADYGVTYTQLGIALAAYNLVSGALQTPAGFLVDRIGARNVLVAGLTVGACAFAVVGMV